MTFPSSTSVLARVLSVSRQSLYYMPVREKKDLLLKRKIQAVLEKHPAYGSRPIAWHLGANRKQVQRIMRKFGLEPTIRPKNRYLGKNTKDSSIKEVPNRMKGMCPVQPNAIWAGDFTHLWFHGRVVYLATVIDVFTREILAWQAGTHHTQSLVLDVLALAKRRKRKTPQIFHTDQGSEYTSQRCLEWLVCHDVKPSWSPKGKPWNNGVQESFFKTFKLEFGKPSLHSTLPDLLEEIGTYVRYYNTERIHSALKMSPHRFARVKKWKR